MYSAGTIANYFLRKSFNANTPITHLKLQKLVFFAHAWYLTLYAKPLLDEVVEAWPFGPVICSLYHRYKIYGREPIDALMPEKEANQSIDEETQRFLDKIWEVYNPKTPLELANMTHTTDGPWHQVWTQRRLKGAEIPNETIKTYFSKKN